MVDDDGEWSVRGEQGGHCLRAHGKSAVLHSGDALSFRAAFLELCSYDMAADMESDVFVESDKLLEQLVEAELVSDPSDLWNQFRSQQSTAALPQLGGELCKLSSQWSALGNRESPWPTVKRLGVGRCLRRIRWGLPTQGQSGTIHSPVSVPRHV